MKRSLFFLILLLPITANASGDYVVESSSLRNDIAHIGTIADINLFLNGELYDIEGLWDGRCDDAMRLNFCRIKLIVDKNSGASEDMIQMHRRNGDYLSIIIPKALKETLLGNYREVELKNVVFSGSSELEYFAPEKIEGTVSQVAHNECHISGKRVWGLPGQIDSLLKVGDNISLYVWNEKYIALCKLSLLEELRAKRAQEVADTERREKQEAAAQKIRKQKEAAAQKEKEEQAARAAKQQAAALKSGSYPIKNIADAAIALDASIDHEYTSGPPVDGPSNNREYFAWEGRLTRKDGKVYLVWNPNYKTGFAFTGVKSMLSNVRVNEYIVVVGRYIRNTEVSLVNGESVVIPLLTDCYVSSEGLRTTSYDDKSGNHSVISSNGVTCPIRGKSELDKMLH